MLKLTCVARLSDGLPLVGSMEDDHNEDLKQYKQQQKQIISQLSQQKQQDLSKGQFTIYQSNGASTNSEKLTIESGNQQFQFCKANFLMIPFLNYFQRSIVMEKGVCYMVLCDKEYSTQLAFKFLDEIKNEFQQIHGGEVDSVERPYAFIKFDNFIQKTLRIYSDSRTKRNIQKLKEDLNEVQHIMKKNIQDLFVREDQLSSMVSKSNEILSGAKNMKTKAVNLNRMYFWRTYGPLLVIAAIVVLVLLLRFLFF